MDIPIAVIEQSFKLIKQIKGTIGELKSVPKNLDDLRQEVSQVQSRLEKLESASETVKISLKPIVRDLKNALSAADKEIRKYIPKDRWNVWEGVKACFGQGAAKQNKHVGEIAQQIHKLSDTLDKQISALTLVTVSGSTQKGHVEKPQIVKNLDELYVKTTEEKICKISYAEIPPRRGRLTRAAREGGHEIHNYTKVRFEINVDKNLFFYVVNYDNATGQIPELFHPNYTSANHSLSSNNIRHFPDQVTYKRDPSCFVIERTEPTSMEGHQMQTVYFVLSPEKMHKDIPPRQLTIEDIEEKIKLEAKEEKPDIIVRRFVFDVTRESKRNQTL